MEFTEDQILRYSRQIILPDVGGKGQQKLRDAKVLLVGAGGLGSPIALYLGAAGIGTIGLIDGDVVDLSNLQRQVLHTTDTVGVPKVESGRRLLAALNPDVTANTYQENIGTDNIMKLVPEYDIVLDCGLRCSLGVRRWGIKLHTDKACYSTVTAHSGIALRRDGHRYGTSPLATVILLYHGIWCTCYCSRNHLLWRNGSAITSSEASTIGYDRHRHVRQLDSPVGDIYSVRLWSETRLSRCTYIHYRTKESG